MENEHQTNEEMIPVYDQGRYSEGRVSFHDFLGHQEKPPQLLPEKQTRIEGLLAEYGLLDQVPLQSWPEDIDQAENFSTADWEDIKSASDRTLCLISHLNYFRLERIYTNQQEIINPDRRLLTYIEDRSLPTPQEIMDLANLPLVYSTSFETLEKIIQNGKVLSDRQYTEQALAGGVGKLDITSNTHSEDREAGLDDFVFAFYGRPHNRDKYGDVQLLFRSDGLFNSSDSFATEHDILDLAEQENGFSRYKSEVVQGRQALFSFARRLKYESSVHHLLEPLKKSFLGGKMDVEAVGAGGKAITFSTWEVKLSNLDLGALEKIVFAKAEDYLKFKEEYGEQFKVSFKPSNNELNILLLRFYLQDASQFMNSLAGRADRTDEYYQAIRQHFPDFEAKLREIGLTPEFDDQVVYNSPSPESNGYAREYLRKCLPEREAELEAELGETMCVIADTKYAEYIDEETDIYKLAGAKIFPDYGEAISYLQREKQYRIDAIERSRRSGFGSVFGQKAERGDDRINISQVFLTVEIPSKDKPIVDSKHRKPGALKRYRISGKKEITV